MRKLPFGSSLQKLGEKEGCGDLSGRRGKKLKRVVLRRFFFMKAPEYVRLIKASECEIKVRQEIERISQGKLQLIPCGCGTESSDIIKGSVEEKIEHLDYEVMCGDKLVAVFEISCTNYAFEGSKFFPVNAYKVERQEKAPTFFVYSLEKERYDLQDRCWWIALEEALKNLLEPKPQWLQTKMPNGEIKPQRNYITDKLAWNRGLKTLVNAIF
jgi:hypothetical protein